MDRYNMVEQYTPLVNCYGYSILKLPSAFHLTELCYHSRQADSGLKIPKSAAGEIKRKIEGKRENGEEIRGKWSQ